VSSLDRARGSIDLVAAPIDACLGIVEHAVFGEDFVNRRDSPGIYPDGAVVCSQVGPATNSPAPGLVINPLLSGRFVEHHLASRATPGLRSISVLGGKSTVFLPGVSQRSVKRPISSSR
jgi:hypothetical protein